MENFKFKDMKINVPLSLHTTMRVGGNAHFFIEPNSVKKFVEIIKFCAKNNIRYFVLGNGSNVIFGDEGYDGVIISTKKINKIKIHKNIAVIDCGVNLFIANKIFIKNALSGMEFTYGIPGTMGGAVYMNAGAYNHEIKDIVHKVMYYNGKKIKIIKNKNTIFSYRDSIFKKNNFVILKVWLKLNKSEKKEVESNCLNNLKKRQISQPLEYPNCGSVFKKVNGVSAGQIIDKLGLKGLKVGGAEISCLHANFIVNKGNASASDVKNLIQQVKAKVKQKSDISLEEEVIIL